MKQEPSRVSLVVTPHKGIRNFLSQISLQAGSIDYANREAVEGLMQRFEEISILLEEHAASENNFILPALEARVPGSSAHDEADHEELHQLQDSLLAQLNHILDADITDEEARRLGYEFYQGLSRLHASHLEHMLEEETVTQITMWEHFTDEEMLEIHARVIQSIPPPVMLAWMKYILPAQTPVERVQLLGGLQANAPAPFFRQVLEIAREVLPAQAYIQMEGSLTASMAG
ncbi:MAG: hemerythrin domain-containing protein [Lewinellaceae bacterium]|nr:hemerythrin domain-containing protein [Phaeodactylibacter sp.]MCB9039166.1 hemerythrin domain-containing protein [Lewinellaceae bacterium]